MFTSSYNHTIDAKNRMFIPAKFREELGEEIVISPSLRDKCLKVCSAAEWEKYIQPIKEMKRAQNEKILRFLNGRSLRLSLDNTGRVQLTNELIDYADLGGKQIVIVGCGDYAEIWSAETYNDLIETTDTDELIRMLEDVGL